MAVRRPLVVLNGVVAEIPAGDSVPSSILPGVATYGLATLNFGLASADQASVTVTGLTGLLTTTHMQAFFQSGDSTADNNAETHKFLAIHASLTCEYVSATSLKINCDLIAFEATHTFKVKYSFAN